MPALKTRWHVQQLHALEYYNDVYRDLARSSYGGRCECARIPEIVGNSYWKGILMASSTDPRSEPSQLPGSQIMVRHRDLLRRMLTYVARKWWIPIGLGVVVALMALVFSLFQTPLYRSTAVLYVTSGVTGNAQGAYQGSLASEQRVSSYVRLVTSDAVLDRALEASKLGMARDDVKRSVSASADPDTVLLTVRAEYLDPNLAAQLVNAVSDSLVSYVNTLETPNDGGAPLAKVSVVTRGAVPDKPFAPPTKRNVAIGFVAGFMFGLGVLLLIRRFDTRIRTGDDVAEAGCDVLGTITDDRRGDASVVDFAGGQSVASEDYRRLRLNLAFVRVDHPPRVMMVTSASAGEGKTTTVLNLAAALAEVGHKVCVVDADLRRPRLATSLGATGDVGFSDYLANRSQLGEVLQPTRIDSVQLLASGAIPPNPSELLSSGRACYGLEQLSKEFDFVLVDTPPLLPVSDGLALSRCVDGVLLVVRAGQTGLHDMNAAVHELEAVDSALLGVVVNGVERSLDNYYGYGRKYVAE